MSEFQIEKNVPMRGWSNLRTYYPFGAMDVGDSFVAPLENRKRVASAATWHGKRHGRKFSVLKISATQIRVWRTA